MAKPELPGSSCTGEIDPGADATVEQILDGGVPVI
jgi:hypothetical protein